jgi:hypothetical protein
MLRRILGTSGPSALSGIAYGLQISMEAPDKALLERMRAALPESWTERPETIIEPGTGPAMRFVMTRDTERGYQILLNDAPLLQDTLDEMLAVFPSVLRQYLAAESRDAVFVHAGAVAFNGRGLILPGRTFAGKTTLVAALIRAGALYYSDEYAVIQPDGLLTPYHKDLSIRLVEGERVQTEHSVAELGGTLGTEPVEIALLVVTEYRVGATWDPEELTPAQGVAELLAHAEPVQARPESTLSAVTRALAETKVLKGRRGDADQTAAALLAMLA